MSANLLDSFPGVNDYMAASSSPLPAGPINAVVDPAGQSSVSSSSGDMNALIDEWMLYNDALEYSDQSNDYTGSMPMSAITGDMISEEEWLNSLYYMPDMQHAK